MSSPTMRYDAALGHTYVPNLRTRIATGGGYLLQTNASGFRSHREFQDERTNDTKRVLVFGDSQSAGDGISNAKRWTDTLESSLPGVEIDNYCVSGTGTDQQFLTWQANAHREHDLVVVAVYVENIRRNVSRVVRSLDSHTEQYQFTPKPYFTTGPDGLDLHNVPVPRDVWTQQTLPDALADHVYPPPIPDGVPDAIVRHSKPGTAVDGRMAPLHRGAKSMAMRFERFRPLRSYDDAADPSWVLLRSILEAWAEQSSAPLLVVPLPHYFFVDQPEQARRYQDRFAELDGAANYHHFDPLAGFGALAAEERRNLWSDSIGHLSAAGHAVLAELLRSPIESILAPISSIAAG